MRKKEDISEQFRRENVVCEHEKGKEPEKDGKDKRKGLFFPTLQTRSLFFKVLPCVTSALFLKKKDETYFCPSPFFSPPPPSCAGSFPVGKFGQTSHGFFFGEAGKFFSGALSYFLGGGGSEEGTAAKKKDVGGTYLQYTTEWIQQY